MIAFTYLSVLALKSGLPWDVEHLTAFLSGMFVGTALAGRRRRTLRMAKIDPVRARSGVALVIATVAVANVVDVVESVYPGMGGIFGPGRASHAPMFKLPLAVLECIRGHPCRYPRPDQNKREGKRP